MTFCCVIFQIELLLVDYNSTDVNIEQLLKLHKVPYRYFFKNDRFNKVKGINLAINNTEKDSIAFVMDLHLQIPDNIFDRIRKVNYNIGNVLVIVRNISIFSMVSRKVLSAASSIKSFCTNPSVYFNYFFNDFTS